MIRSILERARYLSIISILGMLIGAVAAMFLGVFKMYEVIVLSFSKNEKAEPLLYVLFESLDSFLVATALLVIATSLYELFIGELDVPNWMLVKDLTELKSKFTFVIIPVMAVKFVQKILNYENSIDTFYYGVGIGFVTLALATFNYVNLKEKEEHFIEEQTGGPGKKEVRSEDLKKKKI
jgi:uncharacterized membrane protein YqhA